MNDPELKPARWERAKGTYVKDLGDLKLYVGQPDLNTEPPLAGMRATLEVVFRGDTLSRRTIIWPGHRKANTHGLGITGVESCRR